MQYDIDWKLNTDCPLISQFLSFLVVFRENCENNKQRLVKKCIQANVVLKKWFLEIVL